MKPKVSAVIQTRANTLILDFPKSLTELRVALLQSGIPEPPGDIFLMDNEEDPIRVKVYGEDELGRHLARIFSETDDLAKVNTVVFLATDPRTELQEEMRQSILSDKCGSVGDFLSDVQQMLQKLTGYTETFYFPLSAHIQETFSDEPYRVSSEYLAGYEDELMQALEDIRSRDTVNIAKYYNEHLSTAEWISLPIDRDEADRIARKHNEGCIEDCTFYGFESIIPQITAEHYGDMLSFVRLNRLAAEITRMKPSEQVKLKAVLEHEKPRTLDAVQDVVDHLGEYQMDNRIGDPDSYFKEYLLRHLDARFDARWLDTLQVYSHGVSLMERLGVADTEYGMVSSRGGLLYALVPYQQEQGQEEVHTEMTMGGY